MPRCNSGTFSIQRMDHRSSALLFIFFSGTKFPVPSSLTVKGQKAALWMLAGMWCSPAQWAGLLCWNARPTQRLGQGGPREGVHVAFASSGLLWSRERKFLFPWLCPSQFWWKRRMPLISETTEGLSIYVWGRGRLSQRARAVRPLGL